MKHEEENREEDLPLFQNNIEVQGKKAKKPRRRQRKKDSKPRKRNKVAEKKVVEDFKPEKKPQKEKAAKEKPSKIKGRSKAMSLDDLKKGRGKSLAAEAQAERVRSASMIPNGLTGRHGVGLETVFMRPCGPDYDGNSDNWDQEEPFWIVTSPSGGDIALGMLVKEDTLFTFKPTFIPKISGMKGVNIVVEFASYLPPDEFLPKGAKETDPKIALSIGYMDKTGAIKQATTEDMKISGFDVKRFQIPLDELVPQRPLRCRLRILRRSVHWILFGGASILVDLADT